MNSVSKGTKEYRKKYCKFFDYVLHSRSLPSMRRGGQPNVTRLIMFLVLNMHSKGGGSGGGRIIPYLIGVGAIIIVVSARENIYRNKRQQERNGFSMVALLWGEGNWCC